MVWSQLDVTKPHVAYSCVGVFSLVFSLVSLFFKDRLFIGESTVAGIFGIIVGPHCLNWFNPLSWGNADSITLEISRILLCLQVFAVSVELPRKYMLKHWLSVTMLLVPVMIFGWLIIALFVWILIPGLNFPASLLMGGCITATDPVLSQSVVSGRFAQKLPGHLRNLLSCESGCNDGLAFPFVFLSLNLLIYPGRGGEIVKNWLCVTVLWECIFGSFLGVVIGFLGRKAIKFAESKYLIDRESFLSFYLLLAFTCAGFGSMLGIDDLLVSFFAGAAFAWDGWFASKTHESNVSNVIDVLLNYAYFVYLGSIIPWAQFNKSEIGLDVWRLIILSIVIVFLRRIPAVLLLKPLIPDIKSWYEAMFIGHFGPIGVGAVFACLTAKIQLQDSISREKIASGGSKSSHSKYWQTMACLWPITCFAIVTSIVIHGSSVAVFALGRHLNTVTLTLTSTTRRTVENDDDPWLKSNPSLNKPGQSFSLLLPRSSSDPPDGRHTVRASGAAATFSVGIRKRSTRSHEEGKQSGEAFLMQELNLLGQEVSRQKEEEAICLAVRRVDQDREGPFIMPNLINSATKRFMGRAETVSVIYGLDKMVGDTEYHHIDLAETRKTSKCYCQSEMINQSISNLTGGQISQEQDKIAAYSPEVDDMNYLKSQEQLAHIAYTEDDQVIIENLQGEILECARFRKEPCDAESRLFSPKSQGISLTGKNARQLSSPVETFHRIARETTGESYFVYRVDNELIIEDQNGDILRHYHIGFHANGKTGSGRRRKVVTMALPTKGIKNKRKSSNLLNRDLAPKHSDDDFADDEAETYDDEEEFDERPNHSVFGNKKHAD
ncbi:related to Na(+)/H(+) antiporter 2 [Zygosaccharomyces bailii]|nr:related to Na(+)/H(+) antiporter 2 [Zygosaccharomyces bailii]